MPITLDYFQGFLVRAGVPFSEVPIQGRMFTPEQALEMLPHLLATPVTLGNFGPRRMAAWLLLDVATGNVPVSREALHARMRRFAQLLVARPDGYLVEPTTGTAVQRAGEMELGEDGTLRVGRFEVGPFYAIEGGRLFPVDDALAVPDGARPVDLFAPDDGVVSPVVHGAVLAVLDLLEGLYRVVFHTEETLAGLARLPGAVRVMYENAPLLWVEFRHKPHAERVRIVSRLSLGAALTVGTSGAGAAKAASWGGSLGRMAIPLLSLSGEGLLTIRLVAAPGVGRAIAGAGGALGATHVLQMANASASGSGARGWPPVGGPGQWTEDASSMSEQAREYQAQVSGAPRGWCYKVCRNGRCVDYDGYDSRTGTLLEAKAREYAKWFDVDSDPQWGYQGLRGMLDQARRQLRLAGKLRLRWHVAEPRMVEILRKHLDAEGLGAIDVVYTPPLK